MTLRRELQLIDRGDYWLACFEAMASPCEVLLDCENKSDAQALAQIAAQEAWRIEQKFSRYRDDGIVPLINNSAGSPVEVDTETALLLDFAFECYRLSEGLFDISSGVLRKLWHFDGSDNIPESTAVEQLLAFVGLDKVRWEKPTITLARGMEIDFGGIGKEYAVDRCAKLLGEQLDIPLLVNFGGDIAVTRPRRDGSSWQVGIENPDVESDMPARVAIARGGLATSGDAKRFLLHKGKRYSHVLNPLSGWPIENAPRSVTVAAASCIDAGMLATFAMLMGAQAEQFLDEQQVKCWVVR